MHDLIRKHDDDMEIQSKHSRSFPSVRLLKVLDILEKSTVRNTFDEASQELSILILYI
jgi:hypothetical protein